MLKLSPTKLRILIAAVAILVSVVGACGLGIRIDPDGMTLKWDWPDNISLPAPKDNSAHPNPVGPNGLS